MHLVLTWKLIFGLNKLYNEIICKTNQNSKSGYDIKRKLFERDCYT
jgi:hypothetical protein